jgi:S-formylglutathione hydrolase FrmB
MQILNSILRRLVFYLLFIIVAFSAFAGKVDSVTVYSKAMKKGLPCTIVLPKKYKAKGNAYPVLYLLHGYSGWHSNWIQRVPALSNLSDSFQTIIVCPEGGYNSWYFDSPLDSSSQYETFVAKEVPAFIDAHFNTIKNRNGRAISGLSMGGHGALYLATRNKDIFGMAASMSGGVSLFESKGKYEISQKIGDSSTWNNYSVLQSIDSLKAVNLPIFFDCGVDDFFIGGNRALHEKLMRLKIPHTYMEREGGHNWEYWKTSIRYHMAFFQQHFVR